MDPNSSPSSLDGLRADLDTLLTDLPTLKHRELIQQALQTLIQMAEVARKHAEPAGAEGLKLIWVNTWNYWKEATSVEPTIVDDSPKYPGGNYGFDFLEVIRDVFGEETYYTSP